MPYKDPERKKEWERLHRPQRLARRRELRSVEAAQGASQPEAPGTQLSEFGFLVPLVAGGALAAVNPMLGMGAGGVTLAVAAIYKKRWTWWIVGVVILLVGLFFFWNDKNEAESGSGDTTHGVFSPFTN
jgi:hypothetical protein